MKRSPNSSSATLPMYPQVPPSAATPGDGVGDRAARHLDGRAHGVVETTQLVLADKRHGRLDESEVAVDLVRVLGDDVEHGVADAGDGESIRTGFHANETGVGGNVT